MPKKKYGQNFLINDEISKNIANNLNIKSKNIIEIGPGNLSLTKHILSKNPRKFVAVEIDKDLRKNYDNNISQFISFHDALKFNEKEYFNNENFSIISNLPFNISTKLLTKWISLQNKHNCIDSMILMFQKELAERIIAKNNTKKYGRLTILTKAFFNIENKIFVDKQNFFPQPKVDALVLKFTPHKKNKINKKNYKNLEKLTTLFFNERRKKNKKKITKLFNKDQIVNLQLDNLYEKRPENIDEELYYKMSEFI